MTRIVKLLSAVALALMPAIVLAEPASAAVSKWSSVSPGGSHTCGIRTGGALYCWGKGTSGQLGIGSTPSEQKKPAHVGGYSWLTVSAGGASTCAIRSDKALYCWGFNNHGQVGDGTILPRLAPKRVGTGTWQTVSVGGTHTCGVTVSKKLLCWGLNHSGRLGDGTTTERTTPRRVGLAADWSSTSAGDEHSCAIKAGGKLYCWGRNQEGQVGDGTFTTPRLNPTQVSNTGWTRVTAANYSTCGLRGGHVFCWGYNQLGQVGDGTIDNRPTPTEAGSQFDPWKTVDSRGYHSCAIRTNGMLGCWGSNTHGQLGLDHEDDKYTVQREDLGYTDWSTVRTGGGHTCALRSNKTLYCWGDNQFGQLGLGDVDDRDTPRRLA